MAVYHFKLYQFAQKAGDGVMMQAELRACFLVLEGMKRRGLNLDAPIANLYRRLAGMFCAESSTIAETATFQNSRDGCSPST